MHVSDALAYLLDKQNGVQLRQVAVLIDDAVEELPTIHTAERRQGNPSSRSLHGHALTQ